MRFKIAGHETWYQVEKVDVRQAQYVGCPTATHRIIAPRTRTVYYGSFTPTGRPRGGRVKVPGTSLIGVRMTFDGENGGYPLEGHLIED